MKAASDIDWLERIRSFEDAAHEILAQHEASPASRVIKLEATYSKLNLLNLQQHELFKQALLCVEHGLYRAAHVMCWAACMDVIHQQLDNAGMPKIQSLYVNWHKAKSAAELAEYVPEYQLVHALQKLGITSKNETKALLSLLDRRNECAHPSSYSPELNETLGYISECLARIKKLA